VSQPYFDNKSIRAILGWMCFLFSTALILVWAKQKFLNIYFDWSFVLPTLSLFSALLPIGLSVKGWFQEKIDSLESRLEEVEPSLLALRELIDFSKAQNSEIAKHLLRLESKILLTQQLITDLRLKEGIEKNRQILRSIRNNQRQ